MDVLYNIEKAVLQEIDPSTQQPKAESTKLSITTAASCEMEAVVSEGEEKIARTAKKILAIARTDDLPYGYNLTLKDNTFDPEVMSLIAGNKITKDSTTFKSCDAPMMSEGATMKPFALTLYIANYEGDSVKNYVKMTFNNCKGKAPKFSIGSDFYAPEFEIKAREATKLKKPVYSLEYVDTLEG